MLDKIKNLQASIRARASRTNEPDEQHIVAIDIGTEYVKALIGRVTDEGVEIIGVGRTHQGLNDMQAGAIADIAAVSEKCDRALAQAEDQAGVVARSAIMGIAGELVKGTTATVRVTRRMSDKPIDMPELEKIIRTVQERAEEKAKQQLAWELGGKEVDVRLVNSALVGIVIDGYVVTNPIGFKGRDVVVQLYTAFAPLVHIGALERVAQTLDVDLLAVAAEPFAVARSVLGDNSDASMSAILMDVGGGTTDIAVVHEGGVQGTKMFGIGGRAYTRSIERELGTDFETAERYKVAHTPKSTTGNERAVDAALRKTLQVWTSGVQLALGEFTKLDHLPNRVLLCGGGSSLEMLSDALQATDWYRELPFTRRPVVQHIQPDEVVGIVDKTGRVTDHTYITAMGLLRVGVDTLNYNGGGNEGIKDKIDRILRV